MAEFFIKLIPDNEFEQRAIRKASRMARRRRADSNH
jgi:hypothetical protein